MKASLAIIIKIRVNLVPFRFIIKIVSKKKEASDNR